MVIDVGACGDGRGIALKPC